MLANGTGLVRLLDFDIKCKQNERVNECISTYKRVVQNNSSWNAQFIDYTEEQCQDVIGYVQGFSPNPYDHTGKLCTLNYKRIRF